METLQYYEIGNVYERLGKYFIAIDSRKLLTRNTRQKFEIVQTKTPVAHVNDISVEDLCEVWGVKLKHFDKVISKFFQPDEDAKQQARKREHQLKDENEVILNSDFE